MKTSSIRQFMMVSLFSTVTVVGSVMTYWGHRESLHEVQELLDAQLVQYALSLQQLVAPETGELEVVTVPFALLPEACKGDDAEYCEEKYDTKLFFQIVAEDGRLLVESDSAPDFHRIKFREGFSRVEGDDCWWRMFTLYDKKNKHWILVAQEQEIRDELGEVIALQGTTPFVVTLPVLLLLIWWLVGRGLKPVRSLAKEVSRRKANDLEIINIKQVAKELMPLATSVNSLLSRLAAAFTRERRFTADAAHELRTPLAGLGVHLENAASSEGKEQTEALDMARVAHHRMVHLVEQLLVLAKTTPESYLARFQKLDLQPVCQRVIADNIQLALDKSQNISLEADDAVWVQGDVTGIEIMLSNLVRNAELYTPANGSIQVSACLEQGKPTLRVVDNGPGIPEEKKVRVFDRFYRIDGDRHGSNVSGSGLGLSIVAHIVQLHNADIEFLTPDGGGLEVKITFEPASA
ncbi:ATP-binding protein [Spongorhabdus nitratireducens]